MKSLQDQLQDIEVELSALNRSYPNANKIKNTLFKFNNLGCWTTIIITILIFYIYVEIINLLTDRIRAPYIHIISVFYIYLVPFIFFSLFSVYEKIDSLINFFVYKYYNTNEISYNSYNNSKKELLTNRQKIINELEIAITTETNESIRKLLLQVKNRSIPIQSAIKQRDDIYQKSLNNHKYRLEKNTKDLFIELDEYLKKYNSTTSTETYHSSTNKTINKELNIQTVNSINKEDTPNSMSLYEIESTLGKEDKLNPLKLINQTQTDRDKIPSKIDFLQLNELKQSIGLIGERYALSWEKKRLEKIGKIKIPDTIEHTSQKDDSAGFDILSINEDGSPRYIEVKTTTDSVNSPFYLSELEITAMNNLDNYYIYRIFDLNTTLHTCKIYVIDCKREFNKYFSIKPITFKVSPANTNRQENDNN